MHPRVPLKCVGMFGNILLPDVYSCDSRFGGLWENPMTNVLGKRIFRNLCPQRPHPPRPPRVDPAMNHLQAWVQRMKNGNSGNDGRGAGSKSSALIGGGGGGGSSNSSGRKLAASTASARNAAAGGGGRSGRGPPGKRREGAGGAAGWGQEKENALEALKSAARVVRARSRSNVSFFGFSNVFAVSCCLLFVLLLDNGVFLVFVVCSVARQGGGVREVHTAILCFEFVRCCGLMISGGEVALAGLFFFARGAPFWPTRLGRAPSSLRLCQTSTCPPSVAFLPPFPRVL